MIISDIKRNEGNNIYHVGLAFFGEKVWFCDLDIVVDGLAPKKVLQIKKRKITANLLVSAMAKWTSRSYPRILYGNAFKQRAPCSKENLMANFIRTS